MFGVSVVLRLYDFHEPAMTHHVFTSQRAAPDFPVALFGMDDGAGVVGHW